MSTEKIYLTDMSQDNCDAKILDVLVTNTTVNLILDRTVFFPQSGGQASDKGCVEGTGYRLNVIKASEIDGNLIHYCERSDDDSKVEVGEIVRLKIDTDRRRLNTRIHSAGELICAAMYELGYHWPIAGALHFPGQSKIVFDKSLEPSKKHEIRVELESKLEQMVISDSPVQIEQTRDLDYVNLLCGFRPDYLQGKDIIRLIKITPGFARPCMGTHVSRTAEVGKITIRNMKMKKGKLSIGYDVNSE